MNGKIDMLSQEIEIMKKNQMENLKLLNTTSESEKLLDRFNSRMEMTEKKNKINKYRWIKITQTKEQMKIIEKK